MVCESSRYVYSGSPCSVQRGVLNGWAEKTGTGTGVTCAFGRSWRANRLFFFLWKGNIPSGQLVCHTCDNPKCVLPSHLFLGSAKDNIDDCRKKGRLTGPRGEMNGQHKLSESEVRGIRRRYKWRDRSGNNMYDLAREFGVHPVTVWDVIHRRKWASIKEP